MSVKRNLLAFTSIASFTATGLVSYPQRLRTHTVTSSPRQAGRHSVEPELSTADRSSTNRRA